jgi:hypothetical protein
MQCRLLLVVSQILMFDVQCHPVSVNAQRFNLIFESDLFGIEDIALSLLHKQARSDKARASFDAEGLTKLLSEKASKELAVSLFSDDDTPLREISSISEDRLSLPRTSSAALKEAAMAAVALAVAEETVAAKAVGGGADAAILASSRPSDNLDLDDEHEAAALRAETLALRAFSSGFANSDQLDRADLLVKATLGKTARAEIDWPEHSNDQTGRKAFPTASEALPFQGKSSNVDLNHINFVPGSNRSSNGSNFTKSLSNVFGSSRGGIFGNNSVNPFYNPYQVPSGHETWWSSNVFLVILGSLVIVTTVACCGSYSLLDYDEDQLDDEAAMSRSLADGFMGGSATRYCCGTFCFCTRNMCLYLLTALICTIVSGALLWKTGILQPLLAQLLCYSYIILLVVGFVIVLFYEASRGYMKVTNFLLERINKVEGVFHPFKKRAPVPVI